MFTPLLLGHCKGSIPVAYWENLASGRVKMHGLCQQLGYVSAPQVVHHFKEGCHRYHVSVSGSLSHLKPLANPSSLCGLHV